MATRPAISDARTCGEGPGRRGRGSAGETGARAGRGDGGEGRPGRGWRAVRGGRRRRPEEATDLPDAAEDPGLVPEPLGPGDLLGPADEPLRDGHGRRRASPTAPAVLGCPGGAAAPASARPRGSRVDGAAAGGAGAQGSGGGGAGATWGPGAAGGRGGPGSSTEAGVTEPSSACESYYRPVGPRISNNARGGATSPSRCPPSSPAGARRGMQIGRVPVQIRYTLAPSVRTTSARALMGESPGLEAGAPPGGRVGVLTCCASDTGRSGPRCPSCERLGVLCRRRPAEARVSAR